MSVEDCGDVGAMPAIERRKRQESGEHPVIASAEPMARRLNRWLLVFGVNTSKCPGCD